MKKFKSAIALLTILASTSLSAAYYDWHTAASDETNNSENPNSGESAHQGRYFRQDSYDYPSQGTHNQAGTNENMNLRSTRDENLNLRNVPQNANMNRGSYFRQDSYDYPTQQGYNQPQSSCPGGRCGAGANYSSQGQYRQGWENSNQGYSGYGQDQFHHQNAGYGQDQYRHQNYSGYYYDSRSQMDRRNNQFANREINENDEMANKIRSRLQNDPSLSADAKNIQVSFDEGTAILKGNVNSDTEKNKIETAVQQIDGVKSVTNKLNVSK